MVSSRRREAVLGPLLLVAACVAVALLWAERERRGVAGRIDREDEALRVVERVAAAEREHREATGSYGWIGELQAARRLGSLEVARIEGHPVIRSPGYRVEVLLPMQDSETRIVPEGAGDRDAEGSTRRFAVVARPLEPAVSGYRTWYLDERGEVYAAEGAVDLDVRERNPLPDMAAAPSGLGAFGIDWQLIRRAPVPALSR